MTKRKPYIRYLSVFMTVIMFICCFDFSFLNVQANEEISTSNSLDEWVIETVWNNNKEIYNITSDTNINIRPKLTVEYYVNNAQHTYDPGDVIITIPGFGGIQRSGILRAAYSADGWEMTYNSTKDEYTFKNSDTININETRSGGFEVMWDVNSRNALNGYKKTDTPTLTLKNGEESVEKINLPDITLTYESKPDIYNINLNRNNITGSEFESIAKESYDYLWYNYTTSITPVYKARGIKTSDYFVNIKITNDDGTEVDDEYYKQIQFLRSSTGTPFKFEKKVTDPMTNSEGSTQESVWGFYYYSDRRGDISGNITFYIGLPKAYKDNDEFIVNKNITVNAEFITLYYDEKDKVTIRSNDTTVGKNYDCSDLKVSEYHFEYENYTFSHSKYNNKYSNATDTKGRLLIDEIYSSKTVEFVLTGNARKKYNNTSSGTNYSVKSGLADVDGTQPDTELSIPADGSYIMRLGDDRIYIEQKNGIMRQLEPEEYNFEYVYLPYTGRDYDVYVLTADKLVEFNNAYENGNLNDGETVLDYYEKRETVTASATKYQYKCNFSEKSIVGVYVDIEGLSGSFSLSIRAGINFHLNIEKEYKKPENERVNTTGKIVNFSFMQVLLPDGRDVVSSKYSENIDLAAADKKQYGRNNLYREYSNVWLRTYITTINSETSVGHNKLNDTQQEISGVKKVDKSLGGGYVFYADTSGSIKADNSGALKKFSVYAYMGSESMRIDSELDDVYYDLKNYFRGIEIVSAEATTEDGRNVKISDFESRVEYEVKKTKDEKHYIVVANFDFSDMPLEISKITSVKIRYPIRITDADLSGDMKSDKETTTYIITSYTSIKDNVINEETGNRVIVDTGDVDMDGKTTDKVAYSNASTVYDYSTMSYQKQAEKFVKTAISSETSTEYLNGSESQNVIAYATDTPDDARGEYSYRLNYDVGNFTKEAVLYDNIENVQFSGPNGNESKESKWHGCLQSVDTSQIDRFGGVKATVYYMTGVKGKDYYKWCYDNTDQNQDNLKNALNGYKGDGWNEMTRGTDGLWILPDGVNAKDVITVAVHLAFDEPVHHIRFQVTLNMHTPTKTEVKNNGFSCENTYNEFGVLDYSTSGEDNYIYVNTNSGYTQVKLESVKTRVTLKKIDAANGHNLRDAKFVIYIKEGNDYKEVANGSINNLGTVTFMLEPGKEYFYREVVPPKGYMPEEDNVYHPLKPDTAGSTDVLGTKGFILEIKNTRLTGTVLFTKKDKTDGTYTSGDTSISGAKYKLYKSDGTPLFVKESTPNGNINVYEYSTKGVTEELVTGSKGFKVTGLPWGSYYLVETESPKGYILDSETKTPFSFSPADISNEDNGKIREILKIGNHSDEEIMQELRLLKTDEKSGEPLAHARFNLEKLIVNDDGIEEWSLFSEEYQYLSTDVQGEIVVSGLPFGKYRFNEINAPIGYSEVVGESEILTLSADTIDIDVTDDSKTTRINNKRNPGSAILTKLSNEDNTPLEGAKFNLYMVVNNQDGALISPDSTETNKENDDILVTSVTTDSTGKTPIITNFNWGEQYYFQEIYAPKGYVLSTERELFSFTAETADILKEITVKDSQKRGSVELTKTAGEQVIFEDKIYNKGDILNGAVFELYRNDGTKIFADLQGDGTFKCTETALNSSFETKTEGKITITNLPWGGYYFKEISAPNGFAIANNVKFAVNADTCMSTQKLTCEDIVAQCEIKITKHIDDRVQDFGNPTFMFRITGIEETHTGYFTSITLGEGTKDGNKTVKVAPGTYRIEEVPVSRYTLESVSINKLKGAPFGEVLGIGSSQYAEVTLSTGTTPDKVEVVFNNTLAKYDKFSHSTCTVNTIPTEKKVTGISVEYDKKSQPINGGNEICKISLEKNKFSLVLTYDDETIKSITPKDTEEWNKFSPTLSIDYTPDNAGQEGMYNATYTDKNGKIFTTQFGIAYAPLKKVKTKRIIFMTDTAGNSHFNINGMKTSANTVYYTDKNNKWEIDSDHSTYLVPETVLGYTFIGWSKVPETDAENYTADLCSQDDIAKYLSTVENDVIMLYACIIDSKAVDYSYTGTVQTFTAPMDGYYHLETWGAQGGGSIYSATGEYPNDGFADENVIPIEGGRGGYTSAQVYLESGQTIYITVGGRGGEIYYKGGEMSTNATKIDGGYNGGGSASYSDNNGDSYIGGGGGATSIALSFRDINGNEIQYSESTISTGGLLSYYENNTEDILIVAGGGGGSAYYQQSHKGPYWHHGRGGAGGGYVSQGNYDNKSSYNGTQSINGSTQSNAGTGQGSYTSGKFGQGSTHSQWGTGGGGGWYGGSSTGLQGAAGGSGYVSNATVNGKLIVGESIIGSIENGMPSYKGAIDYGVNRNINSGNGELITSNIMTGNQGNGHARITYIPPAADFKYKEDENGNGVVQTFTAPISGYYKLETWGAQGGDGKITMDYNQSGGRGGYSVAEVYLTAGQTLYVCVGGQGETKQGDGETAVIANGGYNGGGSAKAGWSYSSDNYFGGGGGATHIASSLQNTGVLSDYSDHKDDVLLVAGGGGGALYFRLAQYYHHCAGGSGGGAYGGDVSDYYSSISDRPFDTYGGKGASQHPNSGSKMFGQGTGELSGGGGGGWYGGHSYYGGGGGSGYVSNATINGKPIVGESVIGSSENRMPSYEGAMDYGVNRRINNGFGELITSDTMTGNQGDGHARITLISKNDEIKRFYYTGDVQIFTAPKSGDYKLEVWGAQGGGTIDNIRYPTDNLEPTHTDFTGGKGGYSVEEVHLNAGEKLYVYVGGEGKFGSGMEIHPGGWNGGGSSTINDGAGNYGMYAGSGGGATDIRTTDGNWDSSDSLNSRIIVAGGGSSSSYYNHSNNWITHIKGGAGGGEESGISPWYDRRHSGADITGDIQIFPSSDKYGYQLGIGESSYTGCGGGYYGGQCFSQSYGNKLANTGGSGYIASSHNGYTIINKKSISGDFEIPNYYSTGTIIGNSGNGFAKITYVSN